MPVGGFSAFIGISFQTSTLASVVLFIFVAHIYLNLENPITFKLHYGALVASVFTLILILPANFYNSIDFAMILMLVSLEISIKYGIIIGHLNSISLFFLCQSFPDLSCLAECKPGKVELKISARISRMKMITKLRKQIAIASGKFMDLVQEKCSEEFYHSPHLIIYAIIVEEYGLIGGFGAYFIFIIAISICCCLTKANTIFGKLVVLAGVPMIFHD
jgi:cell division protein FtsW